MKRIALCICYDGSRYHGWQFQEEVSSVQQTVEHALSRVANQPVTVICAGRTDSGVHATSQIVHFDTEADRTEHAWVFGANTNLPHDITVMWAQVVPLDFHARFSAVARTYRYVLCNQSMRPGILQKAVAWHYKTLDSERMHIAAQYLLGEHDFSAFRGSGCQANHAIRTVHYLDVMKRGRLVVIEVKANAFLLHMVRNIVGVLIAIGQGDREPIWANEVLHSRDRKLAGITSAPQGLYLVDVDYPSVFNLPKMPKGPFFLD